MLRIIQFILFVVLASAVCHSSCETCIGPTIADCITCDPTALYNFGMGPCMELPGLTTILEEIDSTWAGGTRYLTGIQFDSGIYTPSTTFGFSSPPMTINQLGQGTIFIGFILENIPLNHYKIQVRTHGMLDALNPNCTWYFFDMYLGSDILSFNLTGTDWQNIVQFNHMGQWLEIKYTTSYSQDCPAMTVVDATFIAFVCSTNCTTCIDFAQCTSCGLIGTTIYYLNSQAQCVQHCQLSYYQTSTQYLCDGCDHNCTICYGSPTNCSSCNFLDGYSLAYNQSICVKPCPNAYYTDNLTHSCMPCGADCLTCINSNNTCTSCGLANAGGQMYLYAKKCIFNCPTGTYQNSMTNQCITCDISCAICTGPLSTQCSSCKNTTVNGVLVIFYLAIGQTTCSQSCPSGQYIDSNLANLCQPCSSNCAQCQITSGFCIACPYGYYMYGGSCLSTCLSGTYGDTTAWTCNSCDNACLTCFDNGLNKCYSCTTNANGIYYLQLGTTNCVTVCPSGQIASSTGNLCQACAQQCSTCSIVSTNCTSCTLSNGVTQVYLQNWTCVQTCSTGTFPQILSTTSNVCTTCDITCLTCVGATPENCTSCGNITVMIAGSPTVKNYYKDPLLLVCSLNCPQGYVPISSSNACQQCQSGCMTCQFNSSYCLSCQNVGSINYNLYSNSCISTCPNGFYPHLNFCTPCDVSCSICSDSTNSQCSSCANATINGTFTMLYLAIGTTICNKYCPQGQYINLNVSNKCQPCSALCITCENNQFNCTNNTCPYGYYFYNNSCLSTCISETYGNTTTWQCQGCDSSCVTCFGSGPKKCYACKTDSNTSIIYYLQLGTTYCVTVCPSGQIASSIGNLCLACAQQCFTCSISATNCTSCTLSNGVTPVYLQNWTCVQTCAKGTYPHSLSTTSNVCATCDITCLTCIGATANNCTSCGNATVVITGQSSTVINFKDPTLLICSQSCPLGYAGLIETNKCQQCQSGCITCQSNINNCQKCQAVGNILYFYYSNSCLLLCPDGNYKNTTDLTCYPCKYFTLNQQCLQQCPSGYNGVIKNQSYVCEGCGTNCYLDAPFGIITKLTPSKNLMHEVSFDGGLNRNCTVASISDGLTVELHLSNGRLLASAVPLTILSVSLSSDYQTVIIVTDSHEFDIRSASIGVNFRPGSVISPTGILYSSLSNEIGLENPTFLSSYYQVYGYDMSQQSEGIAFIFFSMILVVISLFFQKNNVVVEMVGYVQTIQIIGLMRVRVLPIILEVYNVLTGFSYCQLLFTPNPITNLIPGLTLSQSSSDSVLLTYGSHNLINNFGSVICLVIVLEIIALILYVIFKNNQSRLNTIKSMQRVVIQIWSIILLYGSITSLLSLENNNLMQSNVLYFSSIVISLSILLCFAIYSIKQFQHILRGEFYKISNFCKVIGLIVLGYRLDIALICFNCIELMLIILEALLFRKEKTNPILYFLEKILILAAINFCLFETNAAKVIIMVGVSLSLIGGFKLYLLMRAIFQYYQRKQVDQMLADASAELNISQGAKSESINRGENNVSNAFNNSQHFIYEQTLPQKVEEKVLEKQMSNEMQQTLNTHNLSKLQMISSLDDTSLKQLASEGEGQRRRRRIKKKTPFPNNPAHYTIDIDDHVETIKIEPKISPRVEPNENQLHPQPEFDQSNNEDLQIISIN